MKSDLFYQAALAVYAVSLVLYVIRFAIRKATVEAVAWGVLVAGFLPHTVAVAMRAVEADHVPWSNLFESLTFIAWTMVFAFLAIGFWVKVRALGMFLLPFPVIGIAVALTLDADQRMPAPLVPALASYWIKIHVPCVILAYGAFAVSFAAAVGYLVKTRFSGARWTAALPSAEMMDLIAYRAVIIGFPLLTFGVFLGAFWANEAWGTYWSWDPKETWSLITWFVYAVYLHARLVAGWTSRTTAWVAIAGFAVVLFCYAGVNMFLSGLHSYAKS